MKNEQDSLSGNQPELDETQSNPPASDPLQIAAKHREKLADARPEHVGPYRILEVLGEGGMGIVYLAEQEQPIRRRAALKIIKLGMDTRRVIARFEAERQALALMNHANVARVFDAGTTESGQPYFVMEHVEGTPITDFCDKARLGTEDRLRLFMGVCLAVQHAHQKGIIHRDIKPSNVLVAVEDGKPVPKVIDFGIAKATEQTLVENTYFTESGQLIGTPAYMSPEQAGADPADIDTRTDVYLLGALVYELLVGYPPFDPKSLRRAAVAEIQRIIREVDPPKPSTRLSALGAEATTIAASRGTETRSLARRVRGDLDWIVMKCLEKDRNRRYETANGLAVEIGRYLNNEPVLAGPPSAAYRLRKFATRNRGPVAAVVTVAFVLVGGLAGTSYGLAHAVRQRRIAQQREAEAVDAKAAYEEQRFLAKETAGELKRISDLELGMLTQIDPTKAGQELTEDLLAKLTNALAKANVPEAKRAEELGAFKALWARVNATHADDAGWLGDYLAKDGESWMELGGFARAELALLEAHSLLAVGFGNHHELTKATINRIIKLYDAWHYAERGKGYDAKAAEWRGNLDEIARERQCHEATKGQDAG